MDLTYLIIITGGILLVLWLFCRFLAFLVRYLSKKLWDVDVRFGSIGFCTFGKIHANIGLQVVLEIEKVWFASSYISPEACKPFTLCCSGTRITLDLNKTEEKSEDDVSDPNAEPEHEEPKVEPKEEPKEGEKDEAEAKAKKDLTSVIRYAQRVGLNLKNVVFVVHGLRTVNCMTEAESITAFCNSSPNDSSLTQGTVDVEKFTCKLLNAAAGRPMATNCLASLSVSAKVFAEVDAKNTSFESMDLCVNRPALHIMEGFISFVNEYRTEAKHDLSPGISLKNTSIYASSSALAPSSSSSSGSLSSSLSSSSLSSTSLHSESSLREKLPRRSSVCVEQLEMKISKDTAAARNVNVLVASVNVCHSEDENEVMAGVHEVQIFSQQANIANLTTLKMDAKIGQDFLIVNGSLDQCFLGYHFEEWQYWSSALFNKPRDPSGSLPQPAPSRRGHGHSHSGPGAGATGDDASVVWWRRRRLKLMVLGTRVSVACANAACAGLKTGASECRLNLTLNPATGGGILTERDAKVEVDCTSLYCKTAHASVPSLQLSSRTHHRNTILFLGMFNAKLSLLGKEKQIEWLMDCIQVELASNNLKLLSKLLAPFLNGLPSPSTTRLPAAKSSSPQPQKAIMVNAELNNINVFLVASNQACSMLRVNLVTVKFVPQILWRAEVTGIKLKYIPQLQPVSDIARSQDMQSIAAMVRKIEVQGAAKSWAVTVKEEMTMRWSYALHMTLHEVFTELHALFKLMPAKEPAPTPSTGKHVNTAAPKINVQIRALVQFTLQLTHAHSVMVQTSKVDVRKSAEGTSIKSPLIDIVFDQHEIIKLTDVSVETEAESSLGTRLERVDLEAPTNRAVHVLLGSLEARFPYSYRFSDCLAEILCCNKWRKLLYPPKLDSAEDGGLERLPADVLFDAKSVMIQICDDPFEVKLGDNHELLQDEQLENEKRVQAMNKRVQELRKVHGLLPASKVEALYRSLQQKSGEVYLQRSRALYASSPMRTRLVAWTFTDLHISALADTAFHGKTNCVKVMRDIDKDSPYPTEGLKFSTLWCRLAKVDVGNITMQLRDYALPMMDISQLHLWGRLVGAEQVPHDRASRDFMVAIGAPWPDMMVKRNMQPLKFFHDFSCDVASFCITYGPCWEPCMQFVNQALNVINKPSSDPSAPLPFWDKNRLLLHGRLTMCADKMSLVFHVSLNPYNMTELMDWTWTNLLLDWTNAKWVLKGDLDIFARTASKYDDCRLLHLPNLRFCVLLEWLCHGNPNDHHSVSPTAPEKVPEATSDAKKYDSYEKFRSYNVNVSVSFETSPIEGAGASAGASESGHGTPPAPNIPACLFYSSTLRWMDKIKMCMARVARPIKRGQMYKTNTPRKLQLSRHYKCNNLSVRIHEFEVLYWGSFAKHHGLEMRGKSFGLHLGTELHLVPILDGLCHRPRADWRIKRWTCDLGASTIYLCCAADQANMSMRAGPVHRNYFLSLEKLSYQRGEEVPAVSEDKSMNVPLETLSRHKIQIYNAKAAWTLSNRNVGISLYDAVMRAQTLKKNLSSAALKSFKVDAPPGSPQKSGTRSNESTPEDSLTQSLASVNSASTASKSASFPTSPLNKMQSGPAYSMLTKLVNESDSKFVAVHEEIAGGNVPLEELHGIAACQTDDVLSRNWHVELINSQVQLRGVESRGYVIVSTGKASILSCDHKPVWRDQQLKSKSTWVGSVESMQYYATVEGGENDGEEDEQEDGEDVVWLTQDQIQQATDHTLLGLESMIGSSQTVGGVIVGSRGERHRTQQLQRIISRCKCQFFFASYGELDSTLPLSPTTAAVTDMLGSTEEGVDSFSLLHHDLNICTNSPQYAMILDIVNNLLLHSEPKKKELLEKVQSMRFELHLKSVADQKTPIQHKQNHLRECIQKLRAQEKALWLSHKAAEEGEGEDTDLLLHIADIEAHIYELKDQITVAADQLAVMVSSYKESQLIAEAEAKQLLATRAGQQEAPLSRRIELCFKHAEWRMTDTDGQIGIADLMMRNFLYTKLNRDDNSGSHQLELGFVKVTNLQPNTPYKDVLGPQDPHGQGFSERQMMLRVLCKFKAPVGGISIREHFEVNVVPLQLQLTKRFHNTVMKFFFPGKNAETDADSSDEEGEPGTSSSSSSKKKRAQKADIKSIANSSFYVDDIDKMKERAAKNNMFLYIKVPEVLLKVSYKGLKDKNIADVHEFTFLLPTLEYHNVTWTWLDMLMAMKSDSKKVLISQAIKQKLHLKSRNMPTLLDNAGATSSQELQEDHKAKLLFGNKILGGVEKSASRKSLFGKPPK